MQSSASFSPFLPQSSSTNTVSQLPPSLTDEQLATLDRLTRESIDERLRILEGVSGAVYRCIDDLLRLRSALPQANLPTETSSSSGSIPPPSSGLQANDNGGDDATTSRGKGKMPERLEIVDDTQVSDSSGEDA